MKKIVHAIIIGLAAAVANPSTAAELVVRGFLVRPGSEFGLDGWMRVTVGPPPLMERFVAELAAVREGMRG